MVDLSRREMTEVVLKVIPYDKWVGAAEISAETGIGSIQVGALIKRDLLNVLVERKLTGPSWRGRHLYRRLRFLSKTKRGDR